MCSVVAFMSGMPRQWPLDGPFFCCTLVFFAAGRYLAECGARNNSMRPAWEAAPASTCSREGSKMALAISKTNMGPHWQAFSNLFFCSSSKGNNFDLRNCVSEKIQFQLWIYLLVLSSCYIRYLPVLNSARNVRTVIKPLPNARGTCGWNQECSLFGGMICKICFNFVGIIYYRIIRTESVGI